MPKPVLVLKPSEYVLYKSGKLDLDELYKGLPPRPSKDKPLPHYANRTPPKEYREGGAKKRSDYAIPSEYKYPIDTHEHVRAAISYFAKPKNRGEYSASEQKAIWGRIRRAAKKFGIAMSGTSNEGGKKKK